MPVRRYRSIEDMPPPPEPRTAADGIAAACDLSSLSRLFREPPCAPRGVRRFRSVQEADDHREAWEHGEPV